MEKDLRLSKVEDGGYAIWGDGQQVQVPLGQSITKPLMPELVGVNTNVNGKIQKGYFGPPEAEFTTSGGPYRLFDYYSFRIWRDGDNIPHTDTEFEITEDLGITNLLINYDFTLSATVSIGELPANIYGIYSNNIELRKIENNWISQHIYFNNFDSTRNVYGQQYLDGHFCLTTDDDTTKALKVILTGYSINGNPIYFKLLKCLINNGNSIYEEKRTNPVFDYLLNISEITIIGGGN